MVDYTAFDSILDSVFVVDSNGTIVYCNDAAASFSQVSIRRLVNKSKISEILELSVEGLLPFAVSSLGRNEPTAFIETEFRLLKVERSGKVQLAIRPLQAGHWGFFIRDVSLEEALYNKFRSELAQKEEYARNLEKLVEARTAELRLANQSLKAILNSLGQGFLTFNSTGDCGNVHTKACEIVLEGIPSGRKIWDVLGVRVSEIEQFRKWAELLFQEPLPFEELKALGPSVYPHSQGQRVELDFFPLRHEGQSVSDVVVVATDKTTEYEARQALDAEKHYAAMVVKLVKSKDQFQKFLQSAELSIDHLLELVKNPMTSKVGEECFRVLHTLEGEAGTFSLSELCKHARLCQQHLAHHRQVEIIPAEAQSILLSDLKSMKSQFARFLEENRDILQMAGLNRRPTVEVEIDSISHFEAELKRKMTGDQLISLYRDLFLKKQVITSLSHFDGLVKAVAEKLGKRVKPLEVRGGELRIFHEPYQRLFSSLVHAFRNAVDHGLETPEEREWAGKEPEGRIQIEFSCAEGWIDLVIQDDGRGIDPTVIREKLKEKFPQRDFSSDSDEQIIQNVFSPGFSSREEVGEFSGRGVGLDAVRAEVINLGGQIQLKSLLGQGTRIHIQVPLVDEVQSLKRSA